MSRLLEAPPAGAQVLQLLMQLMLGPDSQLDQALCIPGPSNAMFPLWRHLACPSNAATIQPLAQWAVQQGPSVSRLLRLLSPALFERQRYALQGVLARGGSSVVRSLPLGTGLAWGRCTAEQLNLML